MGRTITRRGAKATKAKAVAAKISPSSPLAHGSSGGSGNGEQASIELQDSDSEEELGEQEEELEEELDDGMDSSIRLTSLELEVVDIKEKFSDFRSTVEDLISAVNDRIQSIEDKVTAQVSTQVYCRYANIP